MDIKSKSHASELINIFAVIHGLRGSCLVYKRRVTAAKLSEAASRKQRDKFIELLNKVKIQYEHVGYHWKHKAYSPLIYNKNIVTQCEIDEYIAVVASCDEDLILGKILGYEFPHVLHVFPRNKDRCSVSFNVHAGPSASIQLYIFLATPDEIKSLFSTETYDQYQSQQLKWDKLLRELYPNTKDIHMKILITF